MGALRYFALAGLLVGATASAAAWPPAGSTAPEYSGQGAGGADRDYGPYFSAGEVRVIREYFAPRYRSLPPGQQKKLRRTGQLPPGWEKRFEPFPAVLERRLTILPAGYRRGVIDGHAVIFSPRTQIIVDVTMLF